MTSDMPCSRFSTCDGTPERYGDSRSIFALPDTDAFPVSIFKPARVSQKILLKDEQRYRYGTGMGICCRYGTVGYTTVQSPEPCVGKQAVPPRTDTRTRRYDSYHRTRTGDGQVAAFPYSY
eukprot:scaffold393735_cov48-Prasinocladus_malaysianus.AAC.1